MNALTSSILYSLFVERRNENWVFSPASYLAAMSDLALCIKDTNLAELLDKAPDINETQTKGLESYNCLLYAQEYGPHIVASVAEALIARGNDLKPITSPAEMVAMVNAIVREKTHGKIDNLINIDDIGPFLKFVILNCVYFKRDWYNKFDTRTYTEDFKGAKSTTKVRFLNRQIAGQRYYEDEVIDIAEIPYRGEKWEQSDMACYVIVPKTSLFEVFSDLKTHLAKIADVKAGTVNGQTVELNLTAPPFKTESQIELKDFTKAAGVKNVFEPNQEWTLVDLEKLAPGSVMWVAWIKQKAYIDFTEKGTEAAAATAIGMCCCSGAFFGSPPPPPPVKYIRADKPFIYVLANKSQPDKPLFVGVVNDVPDSEAHVERPRARSLFSEPHGSGILLSGVSLYNLL